MTDQSVRALLPHKLPECAQSRALLIAIRRMAIHGLRDASAANLLIGQFGIGARKVAILLRAMLADIARSAENNVLVAPCCAPRMTRDERLMLQAVADPEHAAQPLLDLTGSAECLMPMRTARMLSAALADLGKPVRI